MARSAKPRAQFAIAANASIDRFAKRRKSATHGKEVEYSKRTFISLKERKTLPIEWHENGEDYWPVERIIEERGRGKHTEYLLEWKAHPKTGEVWEPDWEPAAHATASLLEAWEEEKAVRLRSIAKPKSNSRIRPSAGDILQAGEENTPPARKRKRHPARRIIHSSSDTEESSQLSILQRTSSPTQTQVDSDTVHRIVNQVEIAETQQDQSHPSVEVLLPPAPANRADYDTLVSSQTAISSSASDILSYFDNRSGGQCEQARKGLNSDLVRSELKSTPDRPPTQPSTHSAESLVLSSNKTGSTTVTGRSELLPLDISAADSSGCILSGSQTSSTATDSVSDLFFAETDHATPQTSSPSHSAGSRPSSRQEQEAFVSLPSQSHLPTSPSEVHLTSAQPPNQTLQASQISSLSLSSILPDSQPGPDLLSTSFGIQELSDNWTQAVVQTAPSTLLSLPTPRTPLYRLPRPSPQLTTVDNILNSTSPGLLSPKTACKLPTAPPNMGPAKQKSSPRPRPSTPESARQPVDTGPSFRERIRQIRSTRSAGRETSSGPPPIRQATSVMLGRRTEPGSAPSQPQGGPHDTRPPDSPLKREYTAGANQLDGVELPLSSSIAQPTSIYETALGSCTMPIQQSIEEDALDTDTGNDTNNDTGNDTSNDTSNTASQSDTATIQKSSENEQEVLRVGGVVMPTLPILGTGEHAISLPADGRIQSIYQNTIIGKRAKLLKFIRKRESNGLKPIPPSKTAEAIEMAGLIGRLNDTVTHVDLGLEGIGTQYSLRSEQNAAYARYAGAKFALLEHLIDNLQSETCVFAIATKPGMIQDLVEDFLNMKNVKCRRYIPSSTNSEVQPSQTTNRITVHLFTTGSQSSLDVLERPAIIVAFDSSFNAQDPLVRKIRGSEGPPVPVIHLLTANSSEHIDRCLPPDMPSPQRLRLLIRATYQARRNLGGSPFIIAEASETASDEPLDYSDLQKVMKKSPDRRLRLIAERLAGAIRSDDFEANWTLGPMPELEYEEVDESLAKSGQARSCTPQSRAGTPSARKRLLDVESGDSASAKRQRMTPLHDVTHISDSARDPASQLQSEIVKLQSALKTAQEELAPEAKARRAAEAARDYAQRRLDDNTRSLAQLQKRYETRTKLCHDLKKTSMKLQEVIDGTRSRYERTLSENTALREQTGQLKTELIAARDDLKAAGPDVVALEIAREQARDCKLRNEILERSLANTRKDFEFTRQQYQEASTKAAEFVSQVTDLETEAAMLRVQASDEKRRLRELNYQESVRRHLERVEELECEKKMREVVMRKLMEENERLKKVRVGVQTRGNSAQPPGSPGVRSRQGSPAIGHPLGHGHSGSSGMVMGSSGVVGGRASVLRHER